MSDRRVMCADLDAFFVSVEQVLDPSLRGKPVIVGGRPGGRGVVASASYEARAFGVRSAMPVLTAQRLCPQAIFVSGNYARYVEFSKKFFAVMADFSPVVEPGGLDEAFLEATGFEPFYGSTFNMARALKMRVRDELGLPLSIGVASGKVVAKVAATAAKPDGLLEIAPGKEAEFLAPLPANKLPGVGKKTEAALAGLGVRTVGELANTPLTLLKSHFGVSGAYLKSAAAGIDPRPVEPPGEAKSFSRETTFEKDTLDRDFLLATLFRLSEHVGADLRRHGRTARCAGLKLRYTDFTTITRQFTFLQPTDADREIYAAGEKLLSAALLATRLPVRLIGIGVSRLGPPVEQLSLLDAKAKQVSALTLAVDRIRARYGFAAIQTGRTLGRE